jgi:ATP-binding cassette subfamily F protein 3
MISVNQLVVSFGGFELFKKVSFLINPKDRIGLTGKNGAGKSTLLKIIAGEQAPSEGEVIVPKDVRVGYLPQQMAISDNHSVFEETKKAFDEILLLKKRIEHINHQIATRTDYESDEYMELITQVTELNDHHQLVGGSNFEADIEQTLIGLGFKRSDFTRATSEFSGGWRMRIELAKILLKKPEVFLLDEPTNHLDIESIQWLEDFLKGYPGAVVLVSHDRAFLDAVTTRTIEISLGKMYDYKANYSRYLELREEQRETLLAAYKNQQKMIDETEKFIERFRYKATKAVQVQSRSKMLDKIDRLEIDEEDNSRLNIRFQPPERSGTIVVDCKHLTKKYGDLLVLDDIHLTIERGEKVAFVGKNGEGKTTLARVILSELEYKGTMKTGHNVKIGYFAQNQAQRLDGELSVLETIDQIAVGDVRTKIRDILGAFMFSGEDVDKKVKVLSGGERSRLAMIRLMLEPVNFLVLDEPTNHLDMRSKEVLKQALAKYEGTVLIVSHDREFLDGLVKCIYEFKDRKIKQHLGGIYDFLRRKKMDSMKELERKNISSTNITDQKTKPAEDENKLSYEERKDINRTISKLEKTIGQTEDEISKLESEIAELDKKMADPANANDHSIFEEYDQLKAKLEKVLEEWEKSTDKYEALKTQKTW